MARRCVCASQRWPRLVGVFLLAAAVLAAAGSAKTIRPRMITAFADGTRAKVVYYEYPYDYGRSRPRLTVLRRGRVLLAESVSRYPSDRNGRTIVYGVGALPLRVRDLDGDGEPEVLLDLFWGGTRCCMWTRIYRFHAATRRYSATLAFWGNFQDFYRLRDLDRDGRLELVARDGRIERISSRYSYESPIRIFSYQRGRLVDVTRRYPKQIVRDAQRLYRSQWTRESLSAWVADEYLLGRRSAAEREIRRALRLKQLYLPRDQMAGSALAYVRRLHAFLRQAGYT